MTKPSKYDPFSCYGSTGMMPFHFCNCMQCMPCSRVFHPAYLASANFEKSNTQIFSNKDFFSRSYEPTTGVFSLRFSSFVKPGMCWELPKALHLAFEDAWLEGCWEPFSVCFTQVCVNAVAYMDTNTNKIGCRKRRRTCTTYTHTYIWIPSFNHTVSDTNQYIGGYRVFLTGLMHR